MSVAEAISCRELVELVTDYFEGSLDAVDSRRFELHISACDGCSTYVEQMRLVVKASGRLEEESLDPAARAALLDAFRDWKQAG